MNKLLFLGVALFSLASCKTTIDLNGDWVSAYSYNENDSTQAAYYVNDLPRAMQVSDSLIESMYIKIGGIRNDLTFKNPEVTKQMYLRFSKENLLDSLKVISVKKNELRLANNAVVSVYKKLDENNKSVSTPRNFSFHGSYIKTDGDWEMPIDIISDKKYIAKRDSIPSIHGYKWYGFKSYKFFSMDDIGFWPFLLMEVNNNGFQVLRYARQNGKVTFTKQKTSAPEFSLDGLWHLKPENSLPMPYYSENIDTTQLQMTLFFQDNKVWISQYGQEQEKEFFWVFDQSMLYFKNEISNIFPTWEITSRTETTLELTMIPYNPWDAAFKIYRLKFVKEGE